jgi:hypothetical protein
MTISEGATMIGGDIIESGEADAYGHRKLAASVSKLLRQLSESQVKMLCTKWLPI